MRPGSTKTRCSISRESKEFGFSGNNPVQSTASTSINIHYDITS